MPFMTTKNWFNLAVLYFIFHHFFPSDYGNSLLRKANLFIFASNCILFLYDSGINVWKFMAVMALPHLFQLFTVRVKRQAATCI